MAGICFQHHRQGALSEGGLSPERLRMQGPQGAAEKKDQAIKAEERRKAEEKAAAEEARRKYLESEDGKREMLIEAAKSRLRGGVE